MYEKYFNKEALIELNSYNIIYIDLTTCSDKEKTIVLKTIKDNLNEKND